MQVQKATLPPKSESRRQPSKLVQAIFDGKISELAMIDIWFLTGVNTPHPINAGCIIKDNSYKYKVPTGKQWIMLISMYVMSDI